MFERLAAFRAGVCLTLLSLAAIQSGCSSPSPAPDLAVRIGFGLSDEATRSLAMRVLTSLLYTEPLLSAEWDGRPTARIADQWSWEQEGRLLRLRLRDGIVFHDGSRVTSDIVVAILEAFRQSRQGPNYVGGFRYVQAIEAVDERTVTIALSRPDHFLLNELAEITIQRPEAPNLGTGPFKLLSRDSTIELERFENYQAGRPAIRRVSLLSFDTQRSAWTALMRDEIDVVQEVSREAAEFLEGSSQVKTYSLIRPYYIPLVFNLNHALLRNVEVRRALNEAVDRGEIVRQAMRGRGQVADDPIWPFHWAYGGAPRRYAFNPDAARLRLDKEKLPVRPSAKAGQMSGRFELTCLFWNGEPQYERIALLLQRQFAAIDVDLKLTGMELDPLTARAAAGDFDAVLLPMRSGRSLNVTYEYWHSPPEGVAARVKTGYTGADDVLDRIRELRAEPEVRSSITELQRRFYEDAPAIFLAWQETARAVDARIDVGDRTDPDVFANIWRWRAAVAGSARR